MIKTMQNENRVKIAEIEEALNDPDTFDNHADIVTEALEHYRLQLAKTRSADYVPDGWVLVPKDTGQRLGESFLRALFGPEFDTPYILRVNTLLETAPKPKAAALQNNPAHPSIDDKSADTKPVCELCGFPMPEGEEMFKFHGYSGGCPVPHERQEG